MDKKTLAAPVLPWMRVPVEITQDSVVPLENVQGLDGRLLSALRAGTISGLFPVQTVSWRELAGGRSTTHDMCIAAPTGSGKTLAYALPVVQGLTQAHRTAANHPHYIQALVVLPTRDLASQVHAVFQPLCEAVGLKVALVAAQDTPAAEAQQLTGPEKVRYAGADVVVATPGRLMAHLHGTPGVSLQHLKFLVVDEADRLLRQSYQDWLPQVLARLPPAQPMTAAGMSLLPYGLRRTVKIVVSATLTRDPSKLSRLDLTFPRYIAMAGNDHRYKLPRTLQESRVTVAGADKPLALLALLKQLPGQTTLIFTSSLTTTHKLFLLLKAAAEVLPEQAVEYSSLLPAKQRSANLELFKSGAAKVLVASDAMTRGMDVQDVANVINYDAPVYAKTYVHRAGRTARAGRGGAVITLTRPQDVKHFKAMLRKADNNYVREKAVERKLLDEMRPALQHALQEVSELLAAEAEDEAQRAQDGWTPASKKASQAGSTAAVAYRKEGKKRKPQEDVQRADDGAQAAEQDIVDALLNGGRQPGAKRHGRQVQQSEDAGDASDAQGNGNKGGEVEGNGGGVQLHEVDGGEVEESKKKRRKRKDGMREHELGPTDGGAGQPEVVSNGLHVNGVHDTPKKKKKKDSRVVDPADEDADLVYGHHYQDTAGAGKRTAKKREHSLSDGGPVDDIDGGMSERKKRKKQGDADVGAAPADIRNGEMPGLKKKEKNTKKSDRHQDTADAVEPQRQGKRQGRKQGDLHEDARVAAGAVENGGGKLLATGKKQKQKKTQASGSEGNGNEVAGGGMPDSMANGHGQGSEVREGAAGHGQNAAVAKVTAHTKQGSKGLGLDKHAEHQGQGHQKRKKMHP